MENESKLRRIQLVEYEILNVVSEICEKNKIDYWMAYGTMLGAVRHNGFIPWDDDLDIYMRFEDFKRFSRICKSQLPADYFLQTPKSDPLVGNLFFKVRKNNTFMPEDNLKGFSKTIHQGIWIDIFPLVEFSEKEVIGKMQIKILRKLQQLRFYHSEKSNLKHMLRNFAVTIYENVLWKLLLVLGKNSDNYIVVGNAFYPHSEKLISKSILAKRVFNDYKMYTFEKKCFRGIANSNEYLEIQYGNDYMIPKRFNQHVIDYSNVIL